MRFFWPADQATRANAEVIINKPAGNPSAVGGAHLLILAIKAEQKFTKGVSANYSSKNADECF